MRMADPRRTIHHQSPLKTIYGHLSSAFWKFVVVRRLFVCWCVMFGLLKSTTMQAQPDFTNGVNVTQWFQAPSAKQVQFSQFTRKDLEQIKSLGCDVIRLPVNLHAMTSGAPDYVVDPLLFRMLDQVADWTEELGLHLILDNHTFDPNAATDPGIGIVLNAVWRQMAAHFKDRSDLVYYEILNEPHGIATSVWADIQQEAINAIRSEDTKHYIVVGGVNYNSYNDLATLPKYADDKLIYTFHFYDPFLFTHQGASWTDPSLVALSGMPFPYGTSAIPSLPATLRGTWIESAYNNYASEGTVARVKQLIDIAASFKNTRNVPVFCGEFGVYMHNSNDAQRVNWYKAVRDYLKEKNIPWTMWDYRGSFGVFEKNTDEVFETDLNVPLLEALSLQAPFQKPPSTPLITRSFNIYDDYVGAGILNVSSGTDGTLDFFSPDVYEGEFSIHFAHVEQYTTIGFDFRPNLDMSLLPTNNYALSFWLKGDSPASSFDVRFVDSKSSETDRPWRMGITVDKNVVPLDNTWRRVTIPLSDLQEKGSYDNNAWYPPEGKFSWHNIDRLEIVAEMAALDGANFRFDDIQVVGDPIETTAAEPPFINHAFNVSPNPASQSVNVRYDLRRAGNVMITFHSMTGLTVEAWSASQPSGEHEVSFETGSLPTGLYAVRLMTPDGVSTQKIVVK